MSIPIKQATQRNATQRNATQRNATQRNATQRNATQIIFSPIFKSQVYPPFSRYHFENLLRHRLCVRYVLYAKKSRFLIKGAVLGFFTKPASLHLKKQLILYTFSN